MNVLHNLSFELKFQNGFRFVRETVNFNTQLNLSLFNVALWVPLDLQFSSVVTLTILPKF